MKTFLDNKGMIRYENREYIYILGAVDVIHQVAHTVDDYKPDAGSVDYRLFYDFKAQRKPDMPPVDTRIPTTRSRA